MGKRNFIGSMMTLLLVFTFVLASGIKGGDYSLTPTAAAGQQIWESWEGTRYSGVSIRWRQLSYGGWECEFKNDTNSKLRIDYTAEYMNNRGEGRRKTTFSIVNAHSIGRGTYVMDAKYRPRMIYSGTQVIK